MELVALISGLTLEGFKLWQAWCMQNPAATDEEALAYLRQTDADAEATYQRSKEKANRLQAEKDAREAGESTL